MAGHLDYQSIVQWLGEVEESGSYDTAPSGASFFGPFTLRTYAAIAVMLTVHNSAADLQIVQHRTGTSTDLDENTFTHFNDGDSKVVLTPLIADSVTVVVASGFPTVTGFYAIYGVNTPLTSQYATNDGLPGHTVQAYVPARFDGQTFSRAREPYSDDLTAFGIGAVESYLWDTVTHQRPRTPSTFKTRATAAVAAGTPQALWTPAAGKKARLMAGQLSLSVAGQIILLDAATERLRSPDLAPGTPWTLPPIGNGILAAAADNALNVDVSANGDVGGWVGGTEE